MSHSPFEPGTPLRLFADALDVALSFCWSADTSSDPDAWSAHNPAWGQCAVTAVVVQDLLGGEIVWTEAVLPDGRHISHYFNLIHGAEVDLTRRQFPNGTRLSPGVPKTKGFSSTRAYVLSHEETYRRYALLYARVLVRLQDSPTSDCSVP